MNPHVHKVSLYLINLVSEDWMHRQKTLHANAEMQNANAALYVGVMCRNIRYGRFLHAIACACKRYSG